MQKITLNIKSNIVKLLWKYKMADVTVITIGCLIVTVSKKNFDGNVNL